MVYCSGFIFPEGILMTMISRLAVAALATTMLLALVPVAVAQSPAAAQRAAVQQAVQEAQKLTEEQIKDSRDVAALQKLTELYQYAGDKKRYRWTLETLSNLLPGSLPVKLALAVSYASDDMKTQAYDLLLRMQAQGFGMDLENAPEFEKISDTEVWGYIVKNLKVNLEPFGEGRKAFDLPARDLLFNALAWDPVHDKFLVGSVREGNIYHADSSGKISKFIDADNSNKLWATMDMAVDAKRERLWVATTSAVDFRGYNTDNAGKAALVEFNLKNGKLLHRYPLDGYEVYLTTIAVGPDGTVYAADGINRVIYTVADGKLKEMTRNERLNDISALAVSPDGKRLYIADTVLGIIGLDLDSGEAFALAYNPATLLLPGIVDMHIYKDALVVIQPGMQPQRVMRLRLSDDGRKVLKAMPLDAAQPLFKLLGQGAIVGNKLYFMTNSERSKYGRYGTLREGAVLGPVHVYESKLDFAWDNSVSGGPTPLPAARPGISKGVESH